MEFNSAIWLETLYSNDCPYFPIPFFQALELDNIKTHHWLIQDCSAMTGENLLTGIDWIIDDIASRIFTMD